jgi:hypothetical protein
VLFVRIPDTIQAAFGRTTTLRAALDAALDPAVADAPANAGIMSTIYRPIVQQVTANLPAGTDLSVDAVRSQVVDRVVPTVQEALSTGSGGGGASDSLNGDTSFLTGADHRLTAPFLEGFAHASVSVFWVGLGVVLVAFVLSFFLKTPPLRARSALQEKADLQAKQAADQMGALVEPGTGQADAVEPPPQR